ncbi:1-acyl-sn-glycerol-3-phosphate acyltransferase beta-like isoform X1 [Planococcus citri]|uniref:1-acyl-sn-glycerol-3-phosphate acyltransferase beta-like isoform X1 n=1 Tax=Planococcus citri TaxID=170843 RepID=UPI0031F94C01
MEIASGSRHYESIVSFLIAYFNNVVWYPAIILLTAIILQYIFGYESKIRFFACYTAYLTYPAFFGTLVWPFFVLNMRQGVLNCLYGAYICRPVRKIIGVEFELRNGKVLSKEHGTAVVVANHQSFFDVLGMFTFWDVMEKCTAIARKKVFYIWPFGLLAWIAGVVFIDRVPSYEKTHQTINKTAEYVCRQKAKLWMFPEGTRNRNPEKLLPFKKGAFRVAICCQVPVIPVVFSPYYFIDGKTHYFGKGKVIVEALEPIPTKGLTLDDIDTLIEKVYNLMSAKNDEFRAMLKKQREQGKLPCCRNL